MTNEWAQDISPEALEGLHDEAFAWAMSCCHYDHDLARETMQTVYLEILEERARFKGQSSLRTWLFAVIRRVAWCQRRNSTSVERLKTRLRALASSGSEGERMPQNESVPREQIISAIGELPRMQRHIVELAYYRDMTLTEAAHILGISRGSASRHLHRAKKALAEKLLTEDSQ